MHILGFMSIREEHESTVDETDPKAAHYHVAIFVLKQGYRAIPCFLLDLDRRTRLKNKAPFALQKCPGIARAAVCCTYLLDKGAGVYREFPFKNVAGGKIPS